MKIKIYQSTLSLKPTQFSAGLSEIQCKVEEFKAMKGRQLAKLIRETEVPVVISPWKEICLVDRHHFVFACWQADVKKVKVKVVKDYSQSKLTYLKFWRKMAREHHAYLYDQFGEGPRNALYLPIDIRGLADDPYRSLAWLIRQEGGYNNSKEPFAEFQWADFFRSHRLLDSLGRKGFERATIKGIRLAWSDKAQRLPGYKARGAAEVLPHPGFLSARKYLKVFA